jgi:calcyclin binding protein|uniref:CS domain-containing protein n=1 Tax=Globisporangium ultimum (strain ATCC 200006 / CBS 805.95 / DAOM BR144) TaxID=431595 RepID=K3X282_GLOUD
MASPGQDDGDAAASSALHTNIKTKGQNSYYYAHKKRDDVEIHEWDGNAAPRLLKTQQINADDVEVVEVITNYAWADGKKKVSVYITLAGIGAHPEEYTVVDWSASTLSLKIKQYQGKTRVLVLKLYESISDVQTKRKENQLVLQLTKANELRWHSLKKDS